MFRISFEERPTGVTMRIEGRFAGHFASEARQLVAVRNLPSDLVVDLSDVTFVDSAGEDALTWLKTIGAEFVADTSYSLHLCERLQLSRNGNGHKLLATPANP